MSVEYATSYGTTSTDYKSVNKTLSSKKGEGFEITKWIVLDIEETTKTVKMVPKEPTKGTVKLQGSQGYNNAVKLLNDACSSLYSSEGITASSISIDDIEGLLTRATA